MASWTKPTSLAKRSAGILVADLFPDLEPLGGGKKANKMLTEYFSKTGVPTSSLSGSIGDNTLLPSIAEIGDFNTVFEKYSSGTLDPSSSLVMDSVLANMTGGTGSVFGQLSGQLSASGSAAMGNLNPDLSGIEYIPPEDIGTYTSNIYNNLPDNFQVFIDNVLSDATQSSIDAEINNLASALMAEAELNLDTLGGQVMSAFAANGLATSGSAMEAMKQIAIEGAIRVNSQVAQARLGALEILQQNKAFATQTISSLLEAGEAQRAQDVQGQMMQIDALAKIQTAVLNAQAQVQSQLIGAQAMLGAAQLDFISNTFGQLINQSTLEEQARIDALNIPRQTLLAIATGFPTKSRNSGGGISSALGSIGGAVAGSFLGPIGTSIGAKIGGITLPAATGGRG